MSTSNFFGMPVFAGTLHSRMRKTELQMKARERRNNPDVEKTVDERKREQMAADMDRIREGNVVASLDIKLRAGAELSDDEMEYLKTKNPELYKQAVEIKREREQYKKELERCKSKKDVEELRTQKMQSFVVETKAIKSSPYIPEGKKRELMLQLNRRFMGIIAEHTKFTDSVKYKNLTDDDDENELIKPKDKAHEAALKEIEVLEAEFRKVQAQDVLGYELNITQKPTVAAAVVKMAAPLFASREKSAAEDAYSDKSAMKKLDKKA